MSIKEWLIINISVDIAFVLKELRAKTYQNFICDQSLVIMSNLSIYKSSISFIKNGLHACIRYSRWGHANVLCSITQISVSACFFSFHYSLHSYIVKKVAWSPLSLVLPLWWLWITYSKQIQCLDWLKFALGSVCHKAIWIFESIRTLVLNWRNLSFLAIHGKTPFRKKVPTPKYNPSSKFVQKPFAKGQICQ